MSATTRRLLRRLGLLDPLRDLKLRLTYPQQLEERRRFELFYSQFIRPGDLCFDVGANKGARAEIFLRLGARVVAVEPLPKCIAMMESASSSSIHSGSLSSARSSSVSSSSCVEARPFSLSIPAKSAQPEPLLVPLRLSFAIIALLPPSSSIAQM